MNSHERILKSPGHEEPDRIPFDLAGSTWTGITITAYRNFQNVILMFHSSGNVRHIISDLIEPGVDILNPVHINATGIEPVQLKKDFEKDIVFWGGREDARKILPYGTERQINEDVKWNIDVLAPGEGFVFSGVHNIKAEAPTENIMAMHSALEEFGKY